MNGSRQALSLLARCRTVLRPTLSSPTSLERCSVVGSRRRFLCSDSPSNSSNSDEYPKLPISAPIQFAMNVTQASFKQIDWVIKQGIDRDEIMQVNEGAEKILMFVTECIAEDNFDVLNEKLTVEAIEKARTIVAAIPAEKRQEMIFTGITRKFWFSSELNYCCPWRFSTENNDLVLDYFGIRISNTGQNAWNLTLKIRREGSSLSDDFKVSDFFYESYVYPSEEEKS